MTDGSQCVLVLHAGFVANPGHGVLFAGKAGAGKTTAALSCVWAGFDYLGDDYVGIKGLKGGNFDGYRIHNGARAGLLHSVFGRQGSPTVVIL